MRRILIKEDDDWSSKRREELLLNLKGKKEKKSDEDEEIDPTNLTVGQLKSLIKDVKFGKVGRAIKNFAPTALIRLVKLLIPTVGAALSIGSIVKTLMKKPSIADAVPILKGLSVDEEVSRLVDDNVENAFLSEIEEIVDQLDDNIQLTNINMTKMFIKYIKENFDITVIPSGVSKNESKKFSELREFIRESLRA
jgi:hypothetical protein